MFFCYNQFVLNLGGAVHRSRKIKITQKVGIYLALLLVLTFPMFFSVSFKEASLASEEREHWDIINQGQDISYNKMYFTDDQLGFMVTDKTEGPGTNNSYIQKTIDGGESWNNVFTDGSANLMGLYFLNNNIGWAVGGDHDNHGVVYKTTDSGQNWTDQSFATDRDIYSVYFIDENTGWLAAGKLDRWNPLEINGVIYKTTDGGAHWEEKYTGLHNIKDIYFLNSSDGIAVGEYGKILRTTDGGDSWTEIDIDSEVGLNSITFVDTNNGWAGGFKNSDPDQSVVYKTIDGGTSWSETILPTNNMPNQINQIKFLDNSNGWAVGAGKIIKSTDGGASWSQILNIAYDSMGSGGFLNSINIADINTLEVAGRSGIIYKTYDAGSNWKVINTGATLNAVKVFDANTILASGGESGLYKTTDAGNSWYLRSANGTMNNFYFRSNNLGFGFGFNGSLYKTTNQGDSWQQITVPGSGFDGGMWVRSAYFIDESIGWIVLTPRIPEPPIDNYVYKTTDGGASWTEQYHVDSTLVDESIFRDIYFIDENHGFLLHGDGPSGYYETVDGGLTWDAKTLGADFNLNAINFSDANNGWMLGSHEGPGTQQSVIYTTSDAGANWHQQYLTNDYVFNNISINGDNIWFFGGTPQDMFPSQAIVYKSIDNGSTWNLMSKNGPIMNSGSVLNENVSYAVGDSGIIFKYIPESIPPVKVTDLLASANSASSISLTWTAPSDEGPRGRASSYDIRYSTSPIDESNWQDATQISNAPIPASPGVSQNVTVSGLNAHTIYYFGLKSSDSVPNVSELSNIASATTLNTVPEVQNVNAIQGSDGKVSISYQFKDNDSDLLTIGAFYRNTINGWILIDALLSDSTTIKLNNTIGLPDSGTILINNEEISYTSKTDTSLTNCVRGVNFTVAIAHNNSSETYLKLKAVDGQLSKQSSPDYQNGSLIWSAKTDYPSFIDNAGVIRITANDTFYGGYAGDNSNIFILNTQETTTTTTNPSENQPQNQTIVPVGSLDLYYAEDNLLKETAILIAQSPVARFLEKPTALGVAVIAALEPISSAVANLPLVSPLAYLFTYLANLFPSLFSAIGASKAKKKWGRVLDSTSAKPIPQAVVQLYDAQFKRLVETTVTDELGRFSFLTKPGKYLIKVIKPDYSFPSKIFGTGYLGEILNLQDFSQLNLEIYVDPKLSKMAGRIWNLTAFTNFLRMLKFPLLIIGTFLTITFVIAYNRVADVAILAFYLLIWGIEIVRLFQAKSAGKVYSQETQKPIDLSIIRLFNLESGSLVSTKVTDTKGRFNFLVDGGKYKLTSLKDGFKPYEKDNLFISRQEGIVDSDIPMEKIK